MALRGGVETVASARASKCGPARRPAFSLGSRRLSVSRGEATCSGPLPGSAAEPRAEPPRLRHGRPWGPGLFRGCRARPNLQGAQGSCERSRRSCAPSWGARVGPASGSSYGLVQQGGDVLFLVPVGRTKHHHSILDGECVEVVQHDVVGLREQGRVTL